MKKNLFKKFPNIRIYYFIIKKLYGVFKINKLSLRNYNYYLK